MKIINNIIDWFKESNRWKHAIGGAIWAFLYTCVAVIIAHNIWGGFWLGLISSWGIASALEFKDEQWGGKLDENDILATIVGALISGLSVVALAYLFNGILS